MCYRISKQCNSTKQCYQWQYKLTFWQSCFLDFLLPSNLDLERTWWKIIINQISTFFFEINESRLSDTRYLIQDVVSPHCGDKRMARRCTRRSLPNYFDMTSYHWNVRQSTVTWRWWMNGKNNVTSYTKCSLPQSIVHILI